MIKVQIRKCGFPGCGDHAMAIGKRGENSLLGGSKRSKWCRYHSKGPGRQARREYVAKGGQ